MRTMTAGPLFTFNPVPHATPIGDAVGLVENEHGGQVFLHGTLAYVWDADDTAARRATAVNLWRIKAATAAQVGAAFGVGEDTIWACHRALGTDGMQALATEKTGPKGGSKLTTELICRIHALKAMKLSNVKIAAELEVGVSEFSVRRALKLDPTTGKTPAAAPLPSMQTGVQHELPILAEPAPRAAERLAASTCELAEAAPVFTSAPASPTPDCCSCCPRWRPPA